MNIELPRGVSDEMKLLYERIIEYQVEPSEATDVNNDCPKLTNDTDLWKFILFVTRQLMDQKCQNMSVYSRILSLCCGLLFGGVYRFSNELIPLTQWILHLTDEEVVDTSGRMSPKDLEKLLTTSYKNARTVVCGKNYDVVEAAVIHGNVGLLEVVLKFGAVLLKPPASPSIVAIEWINAQISLHRHNLELIELCSSRVSHLSNILEHFDEHERRRMNIVARVLQALGEIWYRPDDAHIYVATLKLLFKSIPEPFVTSREIGEKIEKVLDGSIPHSKVSNICRRFEEFFPENGTLPSPRSLKHLSRCEIRDSMKLAKALPTGVDSLPLPNKLKEYIFLKEDRYLERNPITATHRYVLDRMPAGKPGTVLYYVPKDY